MLKNGITTCYNLHDTPSPPTAVSVAWLWQLLTTASCIITILLLLQPYTFSPTSWRENDHRLLTSKKGWANLRATNPSVSP